MDGGVGKCIDVELGLCCVVMFEVCFLELN